VPVAARAGQVVGELPLTRVVRAVLALVHAAVERPAVAVVGERPALAVVVLAAVRSSASGPCWRSCTRPVGRSAVALAPARSSASAAHAGALGCGHARAGATVPIARGRARARAVVPIARARGPSGGLRPALAVVVLAAVRSSASGPRWRPRWRRGARSRARAGQVVGELPLTRVLLAVLALVHAAIERLALAPWCP
jgi:hypothetical protein